MSANFSLSFFAWCSLDANGNGVGLPTKVQIFRRSQAASENRGDAWPAMDGNPSCYAGTLRVGAIRLPGGEAGLRGAGGVLTFAAFTCPSSPRKQSRVMTWRSI